MSIKDLFGKRSIHIVTQADADKLEKDIESTEYAEAKITDNMRFVPKVTVDFDDPKTFARYGSAEKYYEDAVYSILNKYPYDGSRKEKQEWHNKATYIDNWIFDNKYPRTTGYVSLNTSNAFTTPSAHADTYVYRPFTNPQYVTIKGGPNPTPNNPDGKLSKEYPFWQGKSNIHDSTKIRESNLHVDGSVGNTIEFWWKKEAINESGIECLFYLTNGITIGTADWARLIIEHDDNTSSAAFLKLSYVQDNGSSTDVGIKRTGIGASADFPSGFDATKWNHYAISFKNASANTTHTDIKLYLNGKLITSATQIGTNSKQVSTFNWGTGLMAGLGAYLDAPTSGTYGAMLGLGATRSKLDEFRFWKKERTAEEIGRNWFTQVSGGTNTDDANTTLGVYYKFNEGIVDPDTTSQADSVTLDYSGRISNGSIVNYNTDVRSTGSAIDESNLNNTEFKDPILYSIHPSASSLLEQMKLEGNAHDMTNNSSIYHTLPEWITSDDFENNREDLLNLTQVIANYFDTLHLQIEALPALKNTDYVKDGEKPLPFATKLLESVGFLAPEMFIDSTVLESFLERNEERVFEKDISNVKNHIYQNIYNNISHIYKSKGTEKSFRNLLRCFGIGDQLIKINLYGDNISIKLENNYKSISTRKNYLDFNDPDRHIASCYQESISGNANSTSFISGSTTGQFDYIPFTLEAEVIFPNKSEIDSPAFFGISFTTVSLFGMHEANPAAPTDLSWHGTDDCYFKVQAERAGSDALLDKEAKFKLVTGLTSSTLESPVFKDVYDNQRWNFAVRLKIDKPSTDLIIGTTDTTYTLEFHGVSMLLDTVQEEFTVTAAVTAVKAKAALNAAKRIFVGSEHTDYTGSAVDKCDAKISSVRYWLDHLDNDTIKSHGMDSTNYGSKNPSKPAYLQTSVNQYNLLQADTLALHWDFETATVPAGGSGGLNSDSYFAVEDVSSGSYDIASTNFIYSALKYQHTGKANFYLIGDKKIIDRNYIFTAKQQLPEVINSSDTVNILTQDDITFTKESRPIDYFWAIEKSMYQAVSDEMINIFASISDFNNLIGNPVNRYRMEYKELGKLRQIFFDKVEERPNIEKYVEFYKWIDSSVSNMIQELVPASANFSEEMRTMIESHVLERNKYWNKLPTIEMKAQIPESSALGINEMLYDWKNGYATVVEGDNSLWWHDRVERDNSVIASGTDAVDDDRDNILHVATTHVTGSWMDKNLKSSSGSYKGSTYVLRNLSRPYNFSANREVETEDIVYPISITNIPSPPLNPAPLLEQHDGTFVENPTSVINNQLGNYRFPYDIVQTSGRKNNNSWFSENGGLGSSILTASESITIYGHYDFTLPERTPKKHVFVERFSAPGAPATMQTGMLDVEGEEYSSYNSLNFRNLDVRLRLGEWLTKHFEWDDNIKTPGAPSIPASVVGGPRENFHKLHRNVKHLYLEDGTCTNNYDNYWIQHQIPQSGYQYSWINSSVQTQDCPQGFATDYENIAPQYPQIQTDPSSENYGLASGCHTYAGSVCTTTTLDTGFPFLNKFQSWDKEKHANTYELVRTIDKDGEDIVKGYCPIYWSGSNIVGDDILSNATWDKYESGSLTFNELMLHRNGPYQHPSWKQIRNAENPAVIAMRNSNVISVLDKPSTISYIEGITTASFIQARSGNSTNYIEPVVTWNRPMVHTVLPRGENKHVDLTSTYNNNIETFANPYLAARVEFEKSTEQMYDVIRMEYMTNLGNMGIYRSDGNFTLKDLKYSEYIFPKHNNSSLERSRNRINYGEVSGKSSNGYDRSTANIKTFWKDKPLDRQRTVYSHEGYLNTAENALGARVRNSSVWALDYFKYMTSGEDCTRYTGVTSVRSSSYVATMRGDLAWAGFAQHRGFIYEGTSIDVKSNEGNGRPSEDAKLILPPRPTLQFIHNPNSQKAREEGWPWKAGEISGNAPWNDSYIDYSQDVKLIGQGYSILPEFRVSEHMSYYIEDNDGDFTVDNGSILEISGVDKTVATASYYFSSDGTRENEIIRYSFEENNATDYTTLSKGYMHNTSTRDINNIVIQEPPVDIDSLSAWKSIKEYPVTHLNKDTVSSFLTTTKQINMISKNNDQWMSTDLEFGFKSDTEFKLDATKNSWNNSSIRNRGIPIGHSPITGTAAAWNDDYTWDQWENTFLMSFWVNLDKDTLVTKKADGESIGCLSLHDNRTFSVPPDYFGLDDAALEEAHGIKNTNAANSLSRALSPYSNEVKSIIENIRLHSDLSFESKTRDNKRKLENLQLILKNKELYTKTGSDQASFYLSDIDDEKGRACWVDTIGNKVYFNISPYFNLTDKSKLPDLTSNQWNHVAILYLGGSSTDDSSDMGFDARHHRVFLWINNKLIPSEVPSGLTSDYNTIHANHPTNGTLHQYITRVNSRKITGFGGKKGSLAFGKCNPVRDIHVSNFGYKMKSAILPGKVSDFVIIRGGEIGLVKDSETQPVFESTTVYTTYQGAGDKWDWLFNNKNAFSTLSKMESTLIKDLYQYQSKDINTIVDDWKAKHIKYTTTIAVSQNSTAGTTTSSTNAGSTDLTYNEAKANVQATTNFPVLSGYWKMGIPSWKEEVDAISLVDKDFLDCYSHTDGIKHLSKIINDHLSILPEAVLFDPEDVSATPILRLEVDVVKKLIPYNGFYPSQRAVQLGNLFYDSVSPYVVGDNDTDPWSRARTEQALLQPLFAPGILFNSIKAGIAVDWAAYTGKYDSNRIDLRDKYLGDLSLVTPAESDDPNNIEELKNTAVGKAILSSAMGALSRDIQLGKAQSSNVPELLPKFIERAKTKIGKEAQRMYKSATVRATTEDFEKWAFDNKKDVRVKSTLREFNRTQTKDLKWTPPAKPSIAVSSNMSSIIGKDATVAIQNNPTKAQDLARNIVSAVGGFSSKNIMYGPRGQIGMKSPMSDVSELDLEGTYLDKEPNIRIPFEALVSLSGHLPEAPTGSDDKKVFYLAPSYYLERSETGNLDVDDPTLDHKLYNNLRYPYFEWSGESNALYEMAMHNFLAEIPNFFLRDNKLTTFMSKAEGKFNSVEEGTVYYMDIDLYKTSDSFSTTISPYDGYLTSVYDNPADRNRLVDADGNPYTTQGRYYGPALRCKSKGKCKEDKFYIEDPAQAPYTPPYFYGKAKARLAYRPSMSGKPTLDDIHKNTTIQYINKDLEKKFSSKTSESGSLNTWQDTPAYRGRMPIESSINLFGKTLDSETGEYAWSISTKFESPVLNFDTTSNKEARYYGIERAYWKTSLDVGENPCSTREDRNIYGAVDRDPRGVGMWSGYAKPTGRGSLYLELVKPSSRQQKHSTVDNDIDTNPYIIQLAIKAANNWLGLMYGKITLRDPYGVENEITIGQPNHAPSLRSLLHPTPEAAKIFHVSEQISLYSTHAKIRTVYTAAESTEDNHAKGMSNAFDIEAQLIGGQVGDIGIPMPFDIANAICYHINYRYNKEENFNWVAEVKWVREQDRSGVRGASLGVNSRLEKVKKYDPSFGTNGAVVELEWRPNYKIFRDVSWRLNNPKLHDVPSAKVELPWSEMGTTNEQNKATSGSPFGRSSANTTGKSLPSDILNLYERSQYDSFGQTTSTDFTRVNSVDWAAFYPKIPSSREEKTGSLAEVCGFQPAKSRVGDIADTKIISEAIVMIPFTEKYYEDRSVRIGEYRDEDGKRILSKNFFKISRPLAFGAAVKFEEGDLTNEISSMIDKMQRYNIPPIYDFVKYGLKVDPFVMYIFEFEEELNKDDLANIWQGLMPRCAKAATRYDAEHIENRQIIEHELNEENFFEGKQIPEDIQWMTFKVKKKANIDYYKLTADSIDDKDFKFKVESDDALKPDYSYNWPYDYCSLIEMARVSGGVSITPGKTLDVSPKEEQKIITEVMEETEVEQNEESQMSSGNVLVLGDPADAPEPKPKSGGVEKPKRGFFGGLFS